MKKLAAIFLLLVFLFSLFGYRYLIIFLGDKADQRVESAIDNSEYSDEDLIEIRVALNMPYQQRYTDFERHYGTITLDGKVYHYVKRKIEGDVLVLKCIANEARQQLNNTADQLTKSNSGQDTENSQNQKKGSSFAKVFGADYDDKNQFSFSSTGCLPVAEYVITATAALKDVRLNIPHQPPKHNV